MKRTMALLLLLLLATPSYAWNATGHKAIAMMAYRHLTPETRVRVDALLAKHPDYADWTAGVPPDNRGLVAFMEASRWPDKIRRDPRFHNDNSPPTPDIPGLPQGAQARHVEWHFQATLFSTDGTPTSSTQAGSAVVKLQDFEALGSMPDSMKVYVLPWLLHLVGDVHQPLHTMSRVTRNSPNSDRIGTDVRLDSGSLHIYWDNQLGSSETEQFLTELVATLETRYPEPATLDMNPEHWAQESFALRTQVYAFTGAGTQENPVKLSDEYAANARETSYARAALAAWRLSEFLNQRVR